MLSVPGRPGSGAPRASRSFVPRSRGKRAGKARLKIEQTDPLRRDADANHGGDHFSKLLDPGLALFVTEIALGGDCIFGDDAVDRLQASAAANQQYFMRKSVVVDGEGDLRIPGEGFKFWSFGRRAEDELAPVPVEPDGNDARRAVGPDVGEAGGDARY